MARGEGKGRPWTLYRYVLREFALSFLIAFLFFLCRILREPDPPHGRGHPLQESPARRCPPPSPLCHPLGSGHGLPLRLPRRRPDVHGAAFGGLGIPRDAGGRIAPTPALPPLRRAWHRRHPRILLHQRILPSPGLHPVWEALPESHRLLSGGRAPAMVLEALQGHHHRHRPRGGRLGGGCPHFRQGRWLEGQGDQRQARQPAERTGWGNGPGAGGRLGPDPGQARGQPCRVHELEQHGIPGQAGLGPRDICGHRSLRDVLFRSRPGDRREGTGLWGTPFRPRPGSRGRQGRGRAVL